MTWTRQPAAWRDIECRAALAVLGGGLAALAAAAWLPDRWLPACVFRAWTGRPCLTCGATRALRALLDGRAAEAWRLQPLIVLLLLAAGAWAAYAATGPLLGLPRLRPRPTRREGRLLAAGGIALVLANWAWLLAGGR
jgi:hypothetical protein